MKSKRNKKETQKQLDDQEDEDDSGEPIKWKELRFANFSYNRILEINKFQPRKLLVGLIRN
jgi:hypothetical protein